MLTPFERFFDPFMSVSPFIRRGPARRVEFPPYNVWLSDDSAVITTELPGVNPEDVDISVASKVVTLSGSRKSEELEKGDAYHRRERWHGNFKKSIELPFSIDGQKVSATFNRGILRIELPKVEAEKPRKITIKSE
ncbi:MAG: Hsp20/alpha crystallin family protein [Thermodesulfovibrionales bacterium]|nr:Hsp20/alpha crystallin family protein [Thermodesulfovibrionales bacterium]